MTIYEKVAALAFVWVIVYAVASSAWSKWRSA